MRVSVLGPFRVEEAGEPLVLGGVRRRAVTAYLALHANQVVPSERLVVDLWGDDAPPGTANALQAAVSRLRKVLPANRLVTRLPGYMLRLLPEELDLAQFEQTLTQGSEALTAGRAPEAATLLRQALALWTGPALVDFRYDPFAQAETARVEELRLACWERRIEADLAAGASADLVPELRRLVADHPLRERFRAQLMLALYRTGRQGEALETYRETRELLDGELGVEPSPELSRLERGILRQDPALRRAPLPATAPVYATRRPITAVSIELETASGPGDPMDLEARHLIAARVQALLTPIVESHGGRLIVAPGQPLLAVFGLVCLHEDDALRGAGAAVRLRRALQVESQSLHADRGVRLTCRIGVATAEALVSLGDSPAFVGEAPEIARSLARAAGPQEILISEPVHRLAAAALDVVQTAPGRLSLRSTRFGVRPLSVRLEAPTLDRDAELERLLTTCTTVRRTRSTRVVTVLGEAGIGKTRLIHELSSRLGNTAVVLTGRCLPYGEGITFWPLRELVHEATGGRHDPAAIEALVRAEPDARTIAARLVRAFGTGPPGTADTTEIFWATRRVLQVLARSRLLVVVLEDLHWAEPTFLELLESIAQHLKDAPVAVLCLTRPELLESRPSWPERAASELVPLGPLPDPDADALLAALTGPEPGPAAVRDRLLASAAGNPLYLEQLVASWHERQWGDADAGVPPTIQALLAARLDRLGPAEHEVLTTAAVIGTEFEFGALEAILPPPARTRLRWHLSTLVSKGLLQRHQPARADQGDYGFRHVLIQQAAYRALPKSHRAHLHEQVAEWLEGTTGGQDTPWPEVLAYHLEQATRYSRQVHPGAHSEILARRAVGHLRRSGNAALALGDASAAVKAYERALPLLPPDDPERSPLLVAMGAALLETGRLVEATDVLRAAQAETLERGQRGWHAHARVQRLLLDLHLDPQRAMGETDRDLPGLRQTFSADHDTLGLCRTWQLQAAVCWERCLVADAERAWERAADLARSLGDQRHLTRCLRWLASAALWGPTPAREGITRCRAYLGEIGSTPTGRAVICLHLAGLYAMQDDVRTAEGLLAEGTRILLAVGVRLPTVITQPAALVALLRDDAHAAEHQLRSAFEALSAMGEQTNLTTCAALLAQALVRQGPHRYPEATRLLEVAERDGAGPDLTARFIAAATRARILVGGQDPAGAVTLARHAAALAGRTDLVSQRADVLLDLAHVLSVAADPAAARTAARNARQLYHAKGNRPGVRWCEEFLAQVATG
ncbi:MAG TPA: BTAD domain-containing putative transcriptional regulator [Kineosporiaceae bacterium]